MRDKQIKLKIRRTPSLTGGATCVIVSIENSGTVSVDDKFFRVGDFLTDKLADRLCEQKHLQVVIQLAQP